LSRLFFGIRLSAEALESAVALQDLLRPEITRQGVRFVPREKLHVTLHFLGDLEPGKLTMLGAYGHQIAREIAPFSLKFARIGGFPDLTRPKVLWWGSEDESDAFSNLASKLSRLANASKDENREGCYVPHVTMARITPGSKQVGRIVASMFAENAVPECCAEVSQFELIESSSADGYVTLEEFPLQGSPTS
jgi:RNA 2',3'-cyclic 3'-phosphodiesterase